MKNLFAPIDARRFCVPHALVAVAGLIRLSTCNDQRMAWHHRPGEEAIEPS
jgi:hypothetical protein